MTQRASSCIIGVTTQPYTGGSKMNHYTHFTTEEREESRVLKRNIKNAVLAPILNENLVFLLHLELMIDRIMLLIQPLSKHSNKFQ